MSTRSFKMLADRLVVACSVYVYGGVSDGLRRSLTVCWYAILGHNMAFIGVLIGLYSALLEHPVALH